MKTTDNRSNDRADPQENYPEVPAFDQLNTFKKASTYALLGVAFVLAILLWVYHGAVISMGFIFLEVQFLLVLSALATFTAALREIGEALNVLISGRSKEEMEYDAVMRKLEPTQRP